MLSTSMLSLGSKASYATTKSDRDRWLEDMRPSGSGVWNTPLARNEHSTEMYGFSGKDSDSCHERLAEETARVSVGPMPINLFLQKFLPISDETLAKMPSYEHAFEKCMDAKSEGDIYRPLIQAINADPQHHPARCPGFALRNTSDLSDDSGGSIGSHKPDIICYAEKHLHHVDVKGKGKAKGKAKGKGSDLDAVTDMGFAATFIEVKFPESMDCWVDPEPNDNRASWPFALGDTNPFSSGDKEIGKALGQNAAYAIEIFARQHRGFLLSVSVSGRNARLIRWDRAGLIVSQAFEYTTFPQYLCEFFWRFAHLSDAQRGYDLSVSTATKKEEDYFRRAVKLHVGTQMNTTDDKLLDELSETHYMAGAVSAILLPSEDGNPARKLLVSRPLTKPLSLTGRATRAYWAVEYDPSKPTPPVPKPMVTLKDTWRLHEAYSEPEGTILRQLHAAGVPNIPSIVCDRDVHHDAAPTKSAAGPSQRRYNALVDTLTTIHEDSAGVIMESASAIEGFSEILSSGMQPLWVDSEPGPSPVVVERSTLKRQFVLPASELDKTLTQFYLRPEHKWVCNRSTLLQWVKPRRHYRLVTDVAGYTLLHLSGTHELLNGAYDAFQDSNSRSALKSAALLESPHKPRLHRDVHPGNIILYKRPEDGPNSRRKGYLIDWDVSCIEHSDFHTNGNYLPSLQWQFLATELLMEDGSQDVVHSFKHDMESMFWVVLYCGLLRLQHAEGAGLPLAKIIQHLFDEYRDFKGAKGGYGKHEDRRRRLYTKHVKWDCHALRDWVKVVYDSFSPVGGDESNVLKYRTSRAVSQSTLQAPTIASKRAAEENPPEPAPATKRQEAYHTQMSLNPNWLVPVLVVLAV
ncbi:hypothetical protein FKP32DRAFT_1606062 [Trametes sanguinea]|nr:hypothetical protein FKP32DRAFT_1606062 [Trametes sanguinea]